MQGDLHTNPCNLCPRLCGALRDEGHRGTCGSASSMFVARAALHFWEEPPLSGTSGSGAVFFSGCPLRCVYCQNSAITSGEVGHEVSVDRLAQICLELEGQGALNINFVTPTQHGLQIRDAVALARRLGMTLPVVWNTSGYERVEAIRTLEDTVNVYLADFKYADGESAWRYSRARDYPEVALAAIDAMVEQIGETRYDDFIPPTGAVDGTMEPQRRMTRGVVVRHLVLPGALDASKRALEMLYRRFGDSVVYSIMNQYTPVLSDDLLIRFPELGARVDDAAYEEVLDFADELGIEDYFWQDGPAAEESFIPAWDC